MGRKDVLGESLNISNIMVNKERINSNFRGAPATPPKYPTNPLNNMVPQTFQITKEDKPKCNLMPGVKYRTTTYRLIQKPCDLD